MLDHHSVIRTDVFSYTVAGRHWLADEWGYEVALAWLVRTFGAGSFWLVSAGSCSAAVLLGAATWRRAGAAWLWTAALSALAAGGLVVGLAVRPQDPSYMFFAAELFLLSLARGRTRWLIALPPLLLVWANVHGSFLLGLGVLGLEVLWSVLPDFAGRLRVSRRLPTRPIAATAAVSFGATFVNPHGVALLGYALHVSSLDRAHIANPRMAVTKLSWTARPVPRGGTAALADRHARILGSSTSARRCRHLLCTAYRDTARGPFPSVSRARLVRRVEPGNPFA